MNLKEVKPKVKALIFSIFGLFIVIVLIRMFFTFVDVNASAPIVKFWLNTLSYPFVAPFIGIYPTYFFGINIENAALLSIISMSFFSVIVVKAATFFIEDEPYLILVNIVDLLFKIAEFFLLFRFILALTGGKFLNFGAFVNSLSAFVYEPFKGILPAINLDPAGIYKIELSTMVAIVFVIIFDIVTENILKSLFGRDTPPNTISTDIHTTYSATPQPYQQYQPQPVQQQPANITINVAPGVPQQRVERRVTQRIESSPSGPYDIVGS